MYETSAEPDTPRISVVSTVVNQPVIQPFLFCNYRHHPDNLKAAHYLSTCDVRGWEAIMASTAAPGYFEEVKLGNFVHQVRGVRQREWMVTVPVLGGGAFAMTLYEILNLSLSLLCPPPSQPLLQIAHTHPFYLGWWFVDQQSLCCCCS